MPAAATDSFPRLRPTSIGATTRILGPSSRGATLLAMRSNHDAASESCHHGVRPHRCGMHAARRGGGKYGQFRRLAHRGPDGEAEMTETTTPPEGLTPSGLFAHYEQGVIDRITDFKDPRQEWRRLFSELFGTFLLVLVAAGGGMMSQAFPGVISRTAAVVAPASMVMGVILFMGKISGAHLNPAVSIAFALRRDFPWTRVPGYVAVQLIGATLAALFLRSVVNVPRSTAPTIRRTTTPRCRLLDGARIHHGIGERDPRDGVGGPERRGHRRVRRRGIHCARRTVGQPDLGSFDEPGPHVRSGPGRPNVHRLLGLCRGPHRRCSARGAHRLRPTWARLEDFRVLCCAGGSLHRGQSRSRVAQPHPRTRISRRPQP